MPNSPLYGYANLTFTTTFKDHGHSELGMISNFVNPTVTTTLPMSSYMRGVGSANLISTSTFFKTTTLPLSGMFLNPTSIANLRMKGSFYNLSSTATLSSSAFFFQARNLPLSGTFRQPGSKNLSSSALFNYVRNLNMNTRFYLNGTSSIRMRAMLGNYNANIAMTSTFLVSGRQDFSARINIQNYIAPKTILFASQHDLYMNFNVITTIPKNLVMTATFGGKLPNDLLAKINIVNSYIGVGGIQIVTTTQSIAHSMKSTDLIVYTDATGYFHVGNLQPGTYVVTPVSTLTGFIPVATTVTLTNQNALIYFHATKSFSNSTLFPQAVPVNNSLNCVVTPNNDAPGTLSIEGYVLPADYLSNYSSIMVTASSEDEAANFRAGLPRNVGGGL